jgi:predicted RND superfamily exporter protein
MTTLGYQITLLTGVIPPLMVIIGVPNCILILNKYHAELRKSVRKSIALKTTIEKIALTTFIANLTTAIGFGVLYFTNSDVLKEFGITAAIGVMFTWLICLCLLPIICSFLEAPKTVDLKIHIFNRFLSAINDYVIYQRKHIYYVVGALTILAIAGISQIKVNGFVVDDLPKDDLVYQDLKFFENTFGGVLPLEISIDTKKKNGIMSLSNIKKMDKLERMITAYPQVGNSISLTNALKYSSQVFYNNQPSFYRIPNEMEKNFILLYAANAGKNQNIIKGLIDENRQVSRVTFQIKDIGSKKMNDFLKEIRPRIDSIFHPKKYDVTLTGPVILYVKGTNYLVKNLRDSLLLAIFLIGLIMWILFRGFKMVFISLLPNLIPLMITAGVMGLLGIPLKPTTILIFSIALGIASDQTIYFLTRYRQELNKNTTHPTLVISETIKETGLSMVYTAIILFFGFGVFAFSSFGGTIALGTLLAFTLVLAMLFNLTFLPALLMDIIERKSKLKS